MFQTGIVRGEKLLSKQFRTNWCGYWKQFSQPHCRTQYQQYSFLPRTIRDWNDLPQEVIEAKTIDTFVSRASRLQ